MNKKFWVVLLALLSAFCLLLGLAACGDNGSGGSGGGTEQGGGSTGHVHTYTVDNVCSGCGDQWEYTEGLIYILNEGLLSYEGNQFVGNDSSIEADTYIVMGFSAELDDVESFSIVIPYGYRGKRVTAIGRNAFNAYSQDENYSKLTRVTIPGSVTAIGEAAFSGCSNLTSIEIPEGVTTIEMGAFAGCEGLKNISIPKSVTSIGINAFGETASYNDPANWDESGVLYLGDCLIEADAERLPQSYRIRDNTRAIAVSAFDGCDELTSVEFPGSVNVIGKWAFNGCRGLKRIEIPDCVNVIGVAAFEYCSELKDIAIGNGVTSFGWNAFHETAYYNEPANWDESGVLYLGDYLINVMDIWTLSGEYRIRDNTRVIADYAFTSGSGTTMGCRALTGIAFPDSVIAIGDHAFDGCGLTGELKIPDSVITIGEWAFSGCSGLTEVKIPAGVTSIGKGVFSNCGGLERVTIPEGVTSIGSEAFYACRGLARVTIPESVTSIGNSAFNSSGLTSIEIPKNVTTIGNSAFYGCDLIERIVIPTGVTSIEESLFSYCNGLTSITIPEGVTSIGEGAFRSCTELSEIHYHGTIDAWKKIEKTEGWDADTGDYTVTCTDGTIAKDGTETRD